MNELKIGLEYPYEYEGRTISEVIFRRAKFKDLKRWSKIDNEEDRSEQVVCDLAKMSKDEIQEMDAADWQRLDTELQSFLGIGVN